MVTIRNNKQKIKKEYWSAKELSIVYSIPESTIRRWCSKRQIKFYKFKGKLLFKREEFESNVIAYDTITQFN